MSDNLVKSLREKTEEADLDTILKTTLGGYTRKSVREYISLLRRQQYDMQQSFSQELQLSQTERERLAILATHTGNTSFFSFAAEVQFHAKFLTWWAKFPVPGGSPYASAIRADMSIGDAEFAGPTPYYRPDSRIVRKQYHCHKDNV